MDKKNIIFNNITIVSKSGKNSSSNIKIFVILSFRNTTCMSFRNVSFRNAL